MRFLTEELHDISTLLVIKKELLYIEAKYSLAINALLAMFTCKPAPW